MARFLPNGIGESLGDTLVLAEPLHISGDVWYVSSELGTDAVAPQGLDQYHPLATIAQAYTNAAAGDIIVLAEDHDETVTATLTVAKALTFVGAGNSAGNPTAKLTNNSAAGLIFNITAANVRLRNIKFPANAQAPNEGINRVRVSGAYFRAKNLYFECDATDTSPAMHLTTGADGAYIKACTFLSTTTTTLPACGLYISADLAGVYLEDVVFSNGTKGFSYSSGYWAMVGSSAMVGLHMENCSLLLGADVTLHASTTGIVGISTSTMGAEVKW